MDDFTTHAINRAHAGSLMRAYALMHGANPADSTVYMLRACNRADIGRAAYRALQTVKTYN